MYVCACVHTRYSRSFSSRVSQKRGVYRTKTRKTTESRRRLVFRSLRTHECPSRQLLTRTCRAAFSFKRLSERRFYENGFFFFFRRNAS